MWIMVDEDELASRGMEYVQERVAHYKEDDPALQAIEQKYRDNVDLHDGDDLDSDAVVSIGDDNGAYVMYWKWVSDEEAGLTEAEKQLLGHETGE